MSDAVWFDHAGLRVGVVVTAPFGVAHLDDWPWPTVKLERTRREVENFDRVTADGDLICVDSFIHLVTYAEAHNREGAELATRRVVSMAQVPSDMWPLLDASTVLEVLADIAPEVDWSDALDPLMTALATVDNTE
ncbi:hypothetical protein SEA_MARIOKART_71 [Gordonia phage Mariokart]|nr:hypothetical protein SEA_MARIOKART_71 [Gordonia phage Mariokart]